MNSAAALDTFFGDCVEVFSSVVGEADGTSSELAIDYVVAGRPMRVRYANATVAAGFHPALAHLTATPPIDADAATAPDPDPFTLCVWGGEVPGGQLPRPPWESLAYFERGGVRGHHGDRHMLTYDRRPEVLSGVDQQRRLGVFWANDTRRLPYQERAAPFRRVLPGWRHADGLFAVHASAVGGADGGLLLAGTTGSGKSTTSVLCIGSSLGFAGDDFMLVENAPQPYVHSLYSSAKLNRAVLDWRPDLRAAVVNADRLDTEKAVIHAAISWPEHVSTGFPLRAIAIPHPTSESATVVRRVGPDVAFKRLLPDTLFTAHGPVQQVTRGLAELVRSVPCFELALGTDVARVPRTIETLLHECSGES